MTKVESKNSIRPANIGILIEVLKTSNDCINTYIKTGNYGEIAKIIRKEFDLECNTLGVKEFFDIQIEDFELESRKQKHSLYGN